jgi:endonuclease/exonuclease/phosphatase (EEP) superfamily protein YafD
VLISSHFQAVSATVPAILAADHRPVLVELQLRR